MPDFLLFLVEENLMMTLMTVFAGSFAAYFWMRPIDPGLIEPLSAIQMLNSSKGIYLDIRGKDDFEKGHIVNSRNVPSAELESKLDSLRKYKDKPVIVVCERGAQAPAAIKKLRGDGFEKVFHIKGGLHSWRAANLPLMRK